MATQDPPKSARRNFMIPHDVDVEFRRVVAAKLGIGHGHLSDAVVEAMQDWIRKHSKVLPK